MNKILDRMAAPTPPLFRKIRNIGLVLTVVSIDLGMTRILVKHAAKVFSELPEEEPLLKRNNRKERFFDYLPKTFSRKDFLAIGRHHAIPDKTVERYILEFCKVGMVRNDDRGQYSKTITSELQV